jgi:hypothetical protein
VSFFFFLGSAIVFAFVGDEQNQKGRCELGRGEEDEDERRQIFHRR